MINYEQPGFYRFSEDSIRLSLLARKFCRSDVRLSIVDLGAGCGVVGLELASMLDLGAHVVFCELQKDYLPILEANCLQLAQKKSSFTYEILNCDWSQIKRGEFDLVLSNPPYFLDSAGKASSDLRTNTARRWSEQQENDFFNACLQLGHKETLMIFSLRRDVPRFFKEATWLLERQIFHERSDVLTEGVVFRLNVEADKSL